MNRGLFLGLAAVLILAAVGLSRPAEAAGLSLVGVTTEEFTTCPPGACDVYVTFPKYTTLVLVLVAMQTAVNPTVQVTTVDWGPQTGTFVKASPPGADPRTEVWALANPAAGTGSLYVNRTHTVSFAASAAVLTGSTGAVVASVSANGGSVDAQVVLTGAFPQEARTALAFAILGVQPGLGTGAVINANMTQTSYDVVGSGGGVRHSTGYKTLSDGTDQLGWTLSDTTDWSVVAVSVRSTVNAIDYDSSIGFDVFWAALFISILVAGLIMAARFGRWSGGRGL